MVSLMIQYLIGFFVVGSILGTFCTKQIDVIMSKIKDSDALTWKQSLLTNIKVWGLVISSVFVWNLAEGVF